MSRCEAIADLITVDQVYVVIGRKGAAAVEWCEEHCQHPWWVQRDGAEVQFGIQVISIPVTTIAFQSPEDWVLFRLWDK